MILSQSQLSSHAKNTAGFTIIELIISSSVAVIILAGAYMCLSAGVNSQKVIEPRSEVLQNARVAMSMMSADLRNACPLSDEYAFVGIERDLEDNLEQMLAAGNLDFATHNYTPQRPHEGDYCQISYFLGKTPKNPTYEPDQSFGGQRQKTSSESDTNGSSVDMEDNTIRPVTMSLFRRRNPVIGIDAFSGGTVEELLRGIRGLRFEYYDGYDWYDTWGETDVDLKAKNTSRQDDDSNNMNGLPQAVRITLFLDPDPKDPNKETDTSSAPVQAPDADSDTTNTFVRPTYQPPLVFQTVVRLELATNAPSTNLDNDTPRSSFRSKSDRSGSRDEGRSRRSDRRRNGKRTGGTSE
mgnify:CR=1 FL=1